MVRRVTTNGTMYSYKSTLQRTYRGLNQASNRVISNRQFNSYCEDPAAASKAFQLRRARWNTESQMKSNDRVSGKFSQGWDALEKVYNNLGNELGSFSTLRGSSDSTASGRKALGQSLIATAESIVFTMNSKYADEYIFAGADGMNAPFAWDKDGDLTFRGIKVDLDPDDPQFDAVKAVYETGKLDQTQVVSPTAGTPGSRDINIGGYVVTTTATDFKGQLQAFADSYNANKTSRGADWEAKVNSTGDGIIFTARNAGEVGGATAGPPDGAPAQPPLDAAVKVTTAGKDEDVEGRKAAQEANDAMQKMLSETTFVDLGMGFEEGEDGKIKPDTAFNSALCGLKYLGGSDDQVMAGKVYGGYGKDKDGDPLNFISLIKKTGELLYNCDQDTGSWGDDDKAPAWGTTDADGNVTEFESTRTIDRLLGKLQTALGKVSVTHVDLDTDVAFLKSNKDRLKELDTTLNDQIVGTEDLDPAEAITSLMWAQYSYNAALKIGNGILSQSLLDYLS